jgi:transposase
MRKSAQVLPLRCRVVLACAEGATNAAVVARLKLSPATVRDWRSRSWRSGWAACTTSRGGRQPRKITDDDVQRVLVQELEHGPPGATHWSTRSMAAATGLNQTAVSQIWQAFGLKAHQAEHFKLSHRCSSTRSIVACISTRPTRPWTSSPTHTSDPRR